MFACSSSSAPSAGPTIAVFACDASEQLHLIQRAPWIVTCCDIHANRNWLGLVIESIAQPGIQCELFDLKVHITLLYHRLSPSDFDLRRVLEPMQAYLRSLRRGPRQHEQGEYLFRGHCGISKDNPNYACADIFVAWSLHSTLHMLLNKLKELVPLECYQWRDGFHISSERTSLTEVISQF